MVLWRHLRTRSVKCFSNHLKRCYHRAHGFVSIDDGSTGRSACLGHHSASIFRRPNEMYIPARFYAAPVQAKPKPEAKETQGPRLNTAITAPTVRLVTDEGHCILSRHEALKRAMNLKLDLVEVQRHADPPVCKIMDFHREKYKQQVKEKDRTNCKSEATLRKDCKEIRFTGKIDQKDLEMKADTIKRLMERGYRVKCMAMGKEEEDLGGLLSRLTVLIEDVAYVESGPRVERKQAFAVVRHIKYGAPKKSAGKKSNAVGSANIEVKSAGVAQMRSRALPMQNSDQSEFRLDLGSEDHPDQEAVKEGPEDNNEVESFGEQETWSIVGTSENADDIFNINDSKEENVPAAVMNGDLREMLNAAKSFQQQPPIASEKNNRGEKTVPDYANAGGTVHHIDTQAFKRLVDPVQPEPMRAKSRTSGPSESISRVAESKWTADSVNSSARSLKPPSMEKAESNRTADSVDSSSRSLKPLLKEDVKKNVDPKQGQPLSSYGIFSTPKSASSGNQRGHKEDTIEEQSSINSIRSPSLGRPGIGGNLRGPNSDISQQETNKRAAGGWGIFSREAPPTSQHRSSDGSNKVQR